MFSHFYRKFFLGIFKVTPLLNTQSMNTKLAEVKPIRIKEAERKSTLVPEVLSYLGALLFIAGVSLILFQQWEEITEAQKTATFSLLAIAFFTAGLLAGDTEDIRRRVSSFLYVLSSSAAGLAVYITFPEDLAPFRALALAAVISLFGYTISQSALGHMALFSTTAGMLLALVYENVESTELRVYTAASVTIALSLFWILLAGIRTIETDLGFALGTWSFFLASQGAFAYDYHSLSYSIALGLVATCLWMYTKVRSWVLVASAILAFVVSLSEFVLETLDGSIPAAIGLLAIGAVTVLLGIRSIGSRRT